MNQYTPTDDEAVAAHAVARRRNTMNGGGTNLPGGETATERDRELQHYVSCLAEIAVSRITNTAWTGCGKGALGLKDVGGKLEIRAVTNRTRGLLIRTKDLDNPAPFVLVHVDTQTRCCQILGWSIIPVVQTHGRVLDEHTDKPCWILPPHRLQPWL